MGVDWSYFNKFEDITDNYMPDRGEGDTMASQAVTAVNKLVYKWYNDGDVYDNTYRFEGWANDLSSYANWLYKYAPDCDDILMKIVPAQTDEDYEEILAELASTVLNKEYLSNLNVPKKGSIYETDGPFHFEDDYEDYEYGEDDDEDYWEDEEEDDEDF